MGKIFRLDQGAQAALITHFPQNNNSGKTSDFRKPSPHWKDALYAINSPFMMESRAERIRREKTNAEGTMETSAQQKRRRKLAKTKPQSESETKISQWIHSTLSLLLEKAREQRMFNDVKCALRVADGNKTAKAAAEVGGCGDMFTLQCFEDQESGDPRSSAIHLHQDVCSSYRLCDVAGVPLTNMSDDSLIMKIDGHKFVIPPQSCSLTSNFQSFVSHGFHSFAVQGGYDLIVLDPPWMNKSVKRKKSYYMLSEEELQVIPIASLCRPGGLVSVWVTNNLRLLEFVRSELFPSWSVKWLADWTWMKITQSGEPVCEVTSPHKKPYEMLMIGRYLPQGDDSDNPRQLSTGQHFESTDEFGHNICSDSPGSVGCNIQFDRCQSEEPLGRDSSVGGRYENVKSGGKVNKESGDETTLTDCSITVNSTKNSVLGGETRENVNLENPYISVSPKLDEKNDPETESIINHYSGESIDLPDKLKSHSQLKESHEPLNSPNEFSISQASKLHKTLDVPEKFMLVSVPCALHSKKPNLHDVLLPYLPKHPRCLELFARNLHPGWTSWGNEPLRHQHVDYFEEHSLLTSQ